MEKILYSTIARSLRRRTCGTVAEEGRTRFFHSDKEKYGTDPEALNQ